MSRKCIICTHEKRKEIDKLLVDPSAQYSAISRMFFGSTKQRDALRRHVQNGHIITKITKAAAAQEALEADNLLLEIQEIETTTKDIVKAALNRKKKNTKTPDHKTALDGIARREKQIELKGKILGSFKGDRPQPPAKELPDEEVERRAREILAKRSAK